jgi:hypothetical protein
MALFERGRRAGLRPTAAVGELAQSEPVPTGAPRSGKDDAGLAEKAPAKPRWEAMAGAQGRTLRWRRVLRYLLYGVTPEPAPSYLGLVEDPEKDKLGICCSGGGIRSAAFNLGALQALQQKGQLERASYLSAVSGGSYIAAAFAMVAKRWPSGDPRPAPNEPQHDDSDPSSFATLGPFARQSPEEQYLRNHSSYMAPDTAALTYIVWRALLGLAFNLLFVSLPLLAAGLLLGEYLYRPHLPNLLGRCASHVGGCKADVHWWSTLPLAALAAAALLALLGMLRRTHDNSGKLLETWSTRLLFVAVALAALLLATPALVDAVRPDSLNVATGSSGAPKNGSVIAGGAGLLGLVLGVLAQLREALVRPKQAYEDAKKAYEDAKKGQEWLSSLSSRARRLIAYLAGGLVGPALLAGVYVFGVSVALASSSHGVRPWVVEVAVGAICAFVLLYSLADLTSWSLHPFYKRRLCSAFALKRLYPKDLTAKERARVEVFPDGEPGSDIPIAVERDYDKLVQLSDTAVEGSKWPTLLVCAAANISDCGATPPGRKVTSFTFSAGTVGGPLVGALPTRTLEEAFEATKRKGWRGKLDDAASAVRRIVGLKTRRRRGSDFSLPAAVAMSGAAISPSMGKLTRRPYTLLLALANVRLGVWVPNPRWVATSPKGSLAFGRARPLYLFREMLGRNRIGARYLYVTDGGHYENLGLVELLRRGCTQIYCFDASGGEGFEVLGDAIALARSELGVEIGAIQPKPLFPGTGGEAEKMAVHVDFRYPASTGKADIQCRLVYARNVMTAGSPWDALAYHKADPSFPHNSTVDQLYTDQKFEGYRVLGERAGQAAVEEMKTAQAPAASSDAQAGQA